MKKIVFTAMAFLGLFTMTFAQQDDLKAAAASLEKKDYIAALDAITKAKKAISDLMADNLASVLPAKFDEYVMEKDPNSRGMDMGGVSVVRVYRKPKPAAAASADKAGASDQAMAPTSPDPMMMMGGQEEIRVEITTNMMMANEVMNAHSASDNGAAAMAGAETKVYRVKGYRAISRGSGGAGSTGMGMSASEQAQVIVGGAFISVSASGLKGKRSGREILGVD